MSEQTNQPAQGNNQLTQMAAKVAADFPRPDWLPPSPPPAIDQLEAAADAQSQAHALGQARAEAEAPIPPLEQ